MVDTVKRHIWDRKLIGKRFEIKNYIPAFKIANIVIDGIRNEIVYWAIIKDDTEEFMKLYELGLQTCEAVAHIILHGGEVEVGDKDGKEQAKYKLSLDRILRGIELNAENRPYDCDLDNLEETTIDSIMQYAIFGETLFV